MTVEDYSSDAIFEELGRAFAILKIVNFVHYFGFGPHRRVLLRASLPRPEYAYAFHKTKMYPTYKLGERSTNYTSILISPAGHYLFKVFDRGSSLSRLPLPLANEVLAALHKAEMTCFVSAASLEVGFIIETLGRRAGIFPLIERPRINLKEFGSINEIDLLAMIQLRKDLRRVKLPEEVRRHKYMLLSNMPPGATTADVFSAKLKNYDAIMGELLK